MPPSMARVAMPPSRPRYHSAIQLSAITHLSLKGTASRLPLRPFALDRPSTAECEITRKLCRGSTCTFCADVRRHVATPASPNE
jgi:hypothetical protein